MDLVSIQAAINSLKAANDIAKSLIGLRDISLVETKTMEFRALTLEAQSFALGAQSEQFALLERISQLEEKVVAMEEWNTEKQKYQLNEFDVGQFAYALKEDAGTTEPAHKLCANCYSRNEKSILQSETRPGRRKVLFCQNCGSDLFAHASGGRSAETPFVVRTKRPK